MSEVDKARSITTNLLEIENKVGQVEVGNQEAVSAAQEIAAALAQIKVGVEQVSSAAQQAEKAAELKILTQRFAAFEARARELANGAPAKQR